MDSFQLFLIKTLVGMSNRGVVGMLCTMDMHRLYIRSNNTNSQCKYDARTNFYIIFFFVFLSADFLSTKSTEKKVPFVLIKERGVKDTCISAEYVFFFYFHCALKFKRIFFFCWEYYIICRKKKNDAK